MRTLKILLIILCCAIDLRAGSLSVRVAADGDDWTAWSNESYGCGSITQIWMGANYDTEAQAWFPNDGFFRFVLGAPQGTTFDSAFVTLTAVLTTSQSAPGRWQIVDADDQTSTFSLYCTEMFNGTTPFVYSSTTVSQTFGAWTAEGTYKSNDIKTILNVVCARAGYTTSSKVCIKWDDQSTQSGADKNHNAYDYSGSSTKCALLTAWWGGGGAPAVFPMRRRHELTTNTTWQWSQPTLASLDNNTEKD